MTCSVRVKDKYLRFQAMIVSRLVETKYSYGIIRGEDLWESSSENNLFSIYIRSNVLSEVSDDTF